MITKLARLVPAVIVLCLLSACNLQSKAPLFAETEGRLLLSSYGSTFASFSLVDGVWKPENETMTFNPSGMHYIASDGKANISVLFAPIDDHWWAAQALEDGKSPNYSLVEANAADIVVHPISCKSLKESGKLDDFVVFNGDDCEVKEGTDRDVLFKMLAASPDDASLKIVPVEVP